MVYYVKKRSTIIANEHKEYPVTITIFFLTFDLSFFSKNSLISTIHIKTLAHPCPKYNHQSLTVARGTDVRRPAAALGAVLGADLLVVRNRRAAGRVAVLPRRLLLLGPLRRTVVVGRRDLLVLGTRRDVLVVWRRRRDPARRLLRLRRITAARRPFVPRQRAVRFVPAIYRLPLIFPPARWAFQAGERRARVD